MVYKFMAIISHDSDGYWARCPEMQGCYSQGDTFEEALENLREAIALGVEDRLASGEAIPESDSVSLVTLQVAV